MKTKLAIAATLVLALSVVALSRVSRSSDSKCLAFPERRPLDVNPLMEAPQCAKGKLEIQGMVNSVLAEKKSLIVIDLSEDNCEDGCPVKRLPVSWLGTMPSKGDRITLTGEVKKKDSKFLFIAESLRSLSKAVRQ